jgi:tetratricopeptide (TPR) repeat protein
VSWQELAPEVRRDLGTLPKGLAEEVGRRLAAAARVIETDPEAAFRHAQEAARVASRVASAREAAGLTAYATGRWDVARAELRAARRLSGTDVYLPVIADCERGLGRPERALEIAGSPAAAKLSVVERVEMRIVASGARRDLGQFDAAVVTLQCPELRQTDQPWTARVRYAYAAALLDAGKPAEAADWFGRAAVADVHGETEAADRLDELNGTLFVEIDHAEIAQAESDDST